MIPRLLLKTILDSPKSVLLLGPRQVGKSTLALSLKPDLHINLNNDKTFLDFKSNPSELIEQIGAVKPRLVFIDEIQRHPTLLNTIQTVLDSAEQKGKIKFIITGSSARKLKRGNANLLPGRIFAYELGPLSAAELEYKLDIAKALELGSLPEVYLLENRNFAEKLLSTYSGVYLKEEIQAEALTRNLEGFSRFIMAAASSSGQVLDFSKIAKQAKVDRKVCSRFYEILDDTLIANRVEVFDKTTSEVKKRPKYYFFDVGVLNGLLNNFKASDDRKGYLFEHVVLNQVLASAKARDLNIKYYYFRTRSGYEVDFIFQIKDKTYAVEVKSGNVTKAEADNLLKFKNIYKEIHGFYIITLENVKRNVSDVVVCDLNTFLKEIGL
ncbi:MAG: ATP-binding protein [Oligoflexia bacterium]|nr:ATP-binding protein [Oligoflexia bacterium]